MRDIQIAPGEFYHVFNRGVDKRRVFLKELDYQRFLEDVFLYNDRDYFHPGGRRVNRDDVVSSKIDQTRAHSPRALVSILSYCLLPNHFHLLLKETVDGGIAKFMHRVCMGYARYFNLKYSRAGRLFEGPFKAVYVVKDAHFWHLPRYIHLNALDLTSLDWREGAVKHWSVARRYLDAYPWSSHPAYCGVTQKIPIVDIKLVRENFPDSLDYWRFLKEWAGRLTIPTADNFSNVTK